MKLMNVNFKRETHENDDNARYDENDEKMTP